MKHTSFIPNNSSKGWNIPTTFKTKRGILEITKQVSITMMMTLLCFTASYAQIWDGSSSNLWSDPANWDTGTVPVAADDVTIPIDATIVIDIDVDVTSITVNGNSDVVFTTIITLTTPEIDVDGSTSHGINVTAGSSLSINAAAGAGGSITVDVDNTTANGIRIAGTLSNVDGTINIGNATGSTITSNGILVTDGTLDNMSGGIINIATLSTAGSTITLDAIRATSGSVVTNNGTLNIGDGDAGNIVTQDGINLNASALTNGGTINIDGAAEGDVTMGGIRSVSSSTLINNGTIHIDEIDGEYGVRNRSIFDNNDSLTIANVADGAADNYGIDNGNAAGDFTNSSVILISDIGDGGDTDSNGILNNADFTNETGGTITISEDIEGDAIENDDTFDNESGATITILDGDNGIYNTDTFTNDGTVDIEDTNTHGILNEMGTFNNNTGGIVAIDTTSNDGIRNDSTSTFTNAGTVDIDNTGNDGIDNRVTSIFTNTGTLTVDDSGMDGIDNQSGSTVDNDGGSITVDNSTEYGLRNRGGGTVFDNDNSASLVISNSGAAFASIDNNATINNLDCSYIEIDELLDNTGGTVNNDAIFKSTYAAGLHILGTFNNTANGLVIDTGGAFGDGTGFASNAGVVAPTQSVCVSADTIGSVFISDTDPITTLGTTWYATASTTGTVVGTWDATSNTFTFDAGFILTENTVETFYYTIGSCTQFGEIQVIVEETPEVEVEAGANGTVTTVNTSNTSATIVICSGEMLDSLDLDNVMAPPTSLLGDPLFAQIVYTGDSSLLAQLGGIMVNDTTAVDLSVTPMSPPPPFNLGTGILFTNTTDSVQTFTVTITPYFETEASAGAPQPQLDTDECAGQPLTVVVAVHPRPVITVSGAGTYCSGETITLVASENSNIPGTYLWFEDAELEQPITAGISGTNSDSLTLSADDIGPFETVYAFFVPTNGNFFCECMPQEVILKVVDCSVAIQDPCACEGDGWFSDEITVTGPPGEVWTVQASTTLYDAVDGTLVSNGATLTETIPGISGAYTLDGFHEDSIGYNITVVNSTRGVTLTTSATCYYPDIAIVGASTDYCVNNSAATITGTVANSAAGTGQFYVNNVAMGSAGSAPLSFTFDPSSIGEGTHTLRFEFDAGTASADSLADPGCTVADSVTFIIHPAPSSTLACNDQVNVSLGVNGTATITPEMLLSGEGTYACYDSYIVDIEGVNGTTLDCSHIGALLKVTIIDPADNQNRCWGYVNVEDKRPPVITCRDTTLICGQDDTPGTLGFPIATDNCDTDLTYTWNDIVLTNPDCNITNVIRRFWTVTDDYNNSNSCIQDITIIVPNIEDIQFPANPSAIECSDYAADNSLTSADSTGRPFIVVGTDTLEIDLPCLWVFEDDQTLTDHECHGELVIIRQWTVMDLCSNNSVQGIQTITVEDNTAPTVTAPASDDVTISYNGSSNSCSAALTVPVATISDNCTDDDDLTINMFVKDSNDNLVGGLSTNGGTVGEFSAGTYNIIFEAADDCGNVNADTVQVTVSDGLIPTAICESHHVVSLTNNGTAIAFASTFDDGSHDNCSSITMDVRRMTNCDGTEATDADFGPFVSFCCDDVNETDPIMIIFRVTDAAGFSNICMTEVTVQDKSTPNITCPNDVTISCGIDYLPLSQFGSPTATTDCAELTITELDSVVNLSSCGAGSVLRSWDITDNTGVSVGTCSQIITIQSTAINTFDITFPDSTVNFTCNDGGDPFAEPEVIFNSEACQSLFINFDQDVYTDGVGACFKVINTWAINDWCQNPLADPSLPGYITFTQIVKVTDDNAPTFDGFPADFTVPLDHNTCSADVPIPNVGTDDICTPDDITVTVSGTLGNTVLVNASTGVTYTGIPAGTYILAYTAEDGCGNTTTQNLRITVSDLEGPGVACSGPNVELVADTNADDTDPNRGWVTIWDNDFICSLSDNCGTTFTTVVQYPSLGTGQTTPPATAGDSITFNCDDLGLVDVDVWVSDESGNWSYVIVEIEVQDNMNACGDSGMSGDQAAIAGRIQDEAGQDIDDVTVEVNDFGMSMITSNNGAFGFSGLEMNNDYTVTPEKDIDPLNGISTFDLVKIQRHVLGIELLDSPYKLIAADANASNSVSGFDIVIIRQLILGINSEFANNTSWRFIDANYNFPNPANPFSSQFPEIYNVNNLSEDMNDANFVAVKIGDVSGDAVANDLLATEDRNANGTVLFDIDDKTLNAGHEYTIDFNLADAEAVSGYQFTLAFDKNALELIELVEGAAKEGNFGMQLLDEGMITGSWNGEATDKTAFSLTFKATKDAQLSDLLTINSRSTRAEAYTTDYELMDIALQFNGHTIVTEGFKLYQNRPNPFKGNTVIGFNLPKSDHVSLTIYDISGRTLKVYEADYGQGYNQISISKDELSAGGILYYQLETSTDIAKKKMIVIE